MPELLKQILVIFCFAVLPGIIGARIAWTKGRNWLGWFFLSGLFPPTLMVIIFHGPLREVSGYYRQCPACREFIKWRDASCKYCRQEISS